MNNYYYSLDENKIGPISLEQIRNLSISENTLVWKEGLTDWVKAKELPELIDYVSKEPPPLPSERQAIEKKVRSKNIESSLQDSLLSKRLWRNYLIVTTVLFIMITIGGLIDDGTSNLFPVYKTNWERQNPLLAVLQDAFYFYSFAAIITLVIGLIEGMLQMNSPQRKSNSASSLKSNDWYGMLFILLIGIILAIVIYVNLGMKR